MPAWKYHVFVCQNRRPPGHPKGSCAERGSMDLYAALRAAVDEKELWETVKVTGSNCLGPCRSGATVVVYPEAVWYGRLTVADVPELVQSHFIDGNPVARLRLPE